MFSHTNTTNSYSFYSYFVTPNVTPNVTANHFFVFFLLLKFTAYLSVKYYLNTYLKGSKYHFKPCKQ